MVTSIKAANPASKQTGKEGLRDLPAIQARGYVELLARSHFSFLQGASAPDEMVEEAIRWGYDGIGLCDLNGLYGVVRGYQAAQSPSLFVASPKAKEGFSYLLGTELTLVDESAIVLIPMTRLGYSHLCELLTLGKRNADKGFSKLSLEQVEKHSEDLLCFALPPVNEARYEILLQIFGSRLYIPIWRDLTWASHEHCQQAFELEEKYQAQLFVTQRPFMHSRHRKPLFDVLTCILHHTTLEEAKNKLIQNGERYLRSLPELNTLWSDRLDLVEKTVEIAARVKFTLAEICYRYPQAQLPAGMTTFEYLRFLTEKGARWRYAGTIPEDVRSRIETELSLIKEMTYEDYFLTLYEICQFADAQKILYQGRGSAANSVVCFCLGLTSVDPLQMDLLFERFITRERTEPPDIDIDFEHSRREEVIQHIYEKYDEHHAAMICTVIRYRARMSLRETCKVFGVPLKAVNAMVKFMGRDGLRRLEDPNVATQFALEPTTLELVIKMAKQLHGFPRHLGIHSGGFLITQDPLCEMVPVEKATMTGRYVIQWNKDDAAVLRLMKIDILSLGMLTCLRRCFELLQTHKQIALSLATLPHDDKPTYDMICKAETVGVFQIESRAQMNTLPRMMPKKFYDLVIEVAIVRPGPLQGGMVHPFLKRRQGLEKVTYAHKTLEKILAKTHGVPIFQEQVMRIAIDAANFSPGEANELRRIMSSAWRKHSTMEAVKVRLIDGLVRHGLTAEYSEQIYKTLEGFASYGFPESHAASFALLTYASCFIKKHHPEIFLCGLLNSQPMGFYPPRVLIGEAQRNGVEVRPLCIQSSQYEYTIEETGLPLKAVRVGLRSLYGLPQKWLEQIINERNLHGPFTDLKDLIHRTSLPKVILHKLAAAGALQSISKNTRELMWQLESLNLDVQSFLWGSPQESFTEEDPDDSEHIPFESNWAAMTREYSTKGFSVHTHPMSILRSYLEEKNAALIKNKYIPYFNSGNLPQLKNRSKTRVAGLVSITQRPPTAKGMCFITLEDEFGFMNIVIPPDIYQQDRMVIYSKSLIEVHGHIEKSKNSLTNVKAHKLLALS